MRAYGYESDMHTVREDEAQVIRAAAERLLAGESLRSIVATLNADGVPTSTGGVWQPVLLKRVLLSPRIAGKRLNKSTNRLRQADWPAILDDVTFKRVGEILNDPERWLGGPPSARVYLLTGGLAHCGICDSPLIARPAGKGRRSYVCTSAPPINGCGKIRVSAQPLEDHVVAHTLARLANPRSAAKIERVLAQMREQAEAARQRVADDQERLAELAAEYAQQKLTKAEWQSARKVISARVDEAQKSIDRHDNAPWPARIQADELVAWWEDATLENQRALLDTLLKAVVVHPASRPGSKFFESERVEIIWR